MISGITSTGRTQTAPRTKTTAAQAAPGFAEALKSAVSTQAKKGTSLDDIFHSASEKYGVPLNLLKAVAKAESDFDPSAVSSCGAEGIMQLMPSTASSLGVQNSFDPEQNVMGGAKYLGQLLTAFGGDPKLAVAAYNAGGGAVRKYGGIPPYKETQNYVKTVLGYAGMDVSVPQTTYPAGVSNDSAASVSGLSVGGALQPTDALLTVDDYRILAQAFVKGLEQTALEEATEEAAQSQAAQGRKKAV